MDPATNQDAEQGSRDLDSGEVRRPRNWKAETSRRRMRLELDPEVRAWDRQPGEGTKPYSQFCVFRDLGADRTLQDTAAVLGRTASGLYTWAVSHRWYERVAAYDEHNDRKAQKERAVEIREMAKRHAQVSMAVLAKVVGRLTSLQPNEIKAADIARLLDVAVKSERLSRGVETEIHRVENAPPRAPVDLSKLTDAELDNLEALAAKVQSGSGST